MKNKKTIKMNRLKFNQKWDLLLDQYKLKKISSKVMIFSISKPILAQSLSSSVMIKENVTVK